MNKKLALPLFFVFCFSTYGQIINIPDPNFKNYLVTQEILDSDGNGLPDTILDSNNNGEVDLNEALAVTILWPAGQQITDLTGLEYFPNLTFLDFSNNYVTAVDLHSLHHLETVRCNNNLLTEINLCGTVAKTLWAESNPNLTYISIRNNVISPIHVGGRSSLPNTPPPPPSLMFPISLQTLCLDPEEINSVSMLPGTSVTFIYDCSLNCDDSPNYITGTVRLDSDGNGCDTADLGTSIPIKISQGGQALYTIYSNGTGFYQTHTVEEGLTFSPQVQSSYFTVNPNAATTTYIGNGNTETIDFCLTPNGAFADLSIDLIATTPARPGFDAHYTIVYKNKGTQTLSGDILLNFDDSRLDFVDAIPATNSVTGGTATWSFSNIAPFETRTVSFTLNVNTPSEVEPVNVGDLLNFNTNITLGSASDQHPEDNYSLLTQTVRGAVDPNDKIVSTLIAPVATPMEYLTYTIRFQNTGNEPAEKVKITDLLDSHLDKSSLEIIAASHAFNAVLHENNQLEFSFENIFLPDATTNEPASHGYVSFKIKPIEGSVIAGESIANQANIYFDFNLPILTNEVSTAFYSLLSTEKPQQALFAFSPNPVKNNIDILFPKATGSQSVRIYNTLGQLVKYFPQQSVSQSLAINVSELKTGTYFLEVISDQEKATKKFIKL